MEENRRICCGIKVRTTKDCNLYDPIHFTHAHTIPLGSVGVIRDFECAKHSKAPGGYYLSIRVDFGDGHETYFRNVGDIGHLDDLEIAGEGE